MQYDNDIALHPLTPFIGLLDRRKSESAYFLPGMAEDAFTSMVKDMKKNRKFGVTTWYMCPGCKSPFGVGDCGMFNGQGKCPSCGTQCGGAHGAASGELTQAQIENMTTKAGHTIDAAHVDGKERRLDTGPRMMVLAMLHTVLSLKQHQHGTQDQLIMKLLEKDVTKMSTSFNISVDNGFVLLHDMVRSAFDLAKADNLIDVQASGARLQVGPANQDISYKPELDGYCILECSICLEDLKTFATVTKVKGCQHKFCTSCIRGVATAGHGAKQCPSCRGTFHGLNGLECITVGGAGANQLKYQQVLDELWSSKLGRWFWEDLVHERHFENIDGKRTGIVNRANA